MPPVAHYAMQALDLASAAHSDPRGMHVHEAVLQCCTPHGVHIRSLIDIVFSC